MKEHYAKTLWIYLTILPLGIIQNYLKYSMANLGQKELSLNKETNNNEKIQEQEQKDKLCYIEICTDKMDMPKLAQDLISKSLAKV